MKSNMRKQQEIVEKLQDKETRRKQKELTDKDKEKEACKRKYLEEEEVAFVDNEE